MKGVEGYYKGCKWCPCPRLVESDTCDCGCPQRVHMLIYNEPLPDPNE